MIYNNSASLSNRFRSNRRCTGIPGINKITLEAVRRFKRYAYDAMFNKLTYTTTLTSKR